MFVKHCLALDMCKRSTVHILEGQKQELWTEMKKINICGLYLENESVLILAISPVYLMTIYFNKTYTRNCDIKTGISS